MLDSVKISRRQSEIRQALAGLVGKDSPTDDETRQMEAMDAEYRSNETRFRAALIAEDTERRDAGADLETRGGREWAELIGKFELRQVALALDEGRALSGATAEVVEEMRSAGGYRGIPVPLQALETRAGETLAADVPNPVSTRPIIDRLFPASVAARMGIETINVDFGALEIPVVTSSIAAGWAPTEIADVPGPVPFTTADRPLRPDHNLGVQLKITRRSLKQAGAALEAAIRRDLAGAISTELDRAIFLGTGAAGQPLGLVPGAATYGITVTAVGAAATWAAVRAAVVTFMTASAATSPNAIRALIRPEMWAALDDAIAETGETEWTRLVEHISAENVTMSPNGLPAPAGDPLASAAVLTTVTAGVAPAYLGLWGGVDVIRDPYTDAASGALRLTGMLTADVTVGRPQQIQILTGLQV